MQRHRSTLKLQWDVATWKTGVCILETSEAHALSPRKYRKITDIMQQTIRFPYDNVTYENYQNNK